MPIYKKIIILENILKNEELSSNLWHKQHLSLIYIAIQHSRYDLLTTLLENPGIRSNIAINDLEELDSFLSVVDEDRTDQITACANVASIAIEKNISKIAIRLLDIRGVGLFISKGHNILELLHKVIITNQNYDLGFKILGFQISNLNIMELQKNYDFIHQILVGVIKYASPTDRKRILNKTNLLFSTLEFTILQNDHLQLKAMLKNELILRKLKGKKYVSLVNIAAKNSRYDVLNTLLEVESIKNNIEIEDLEKLNKSLNNLDDENNNAIESLVKIGCIAIDKNHSKIAIELLNFNKVAYRIISSSNIYQLLDRSIIKNKNYELGIKLLELQSCTYNPDKYLLSYDIVHMALLNVINCDCEIERARILKSTNLLYIALELTILKNDVAQLTNMLSNKVVRNYIVRDKLVSLIQVADKSHEFIRRALLENSYIQDSIFSIACTAIENNDLNSIVPLLNHTTIKNIILSHETIFNLLRTAIITNHNYEIGAILLTNLDFSASKRNNRMHLFFQDILHHITKHSTENDRKTFFKKTNFVNSALILAFELGEDLALKAILNDNLLTREIDVKLYVILLQSAITHLKKEVFTALVGAPELQRNLAVDNNKVFLFAIREEQYWAAEILLTDPNVYAMAAVNNNEAILCAITQYNKNLFYKLINNQAVLDSISTNSRDLVYKSGIYADLDMLNTLLRIKNLAIDINYEILITVIARYRGANLFYEMLHEHPALLSTVQKLNINILIEAIIYGNIDLFYKLVQDEIILNNITALNSSVLITTIQRGAINHRELNISQVKLMRINMVRELLKIENVRIRAHLPNNNALNLARTYQIPEIEIMLLEIEAVRRIANALNSSFPLSTNTHTASIHESVSESAIKLYTTYSVSEFNVDMINMDKYFEYDDVTNKSGNMSKLRDLIAKEYLYDGSSPELNDKKIIESVKNGVARVLGTAFVDPKSNVSLADLFRIILVGINKLSGHEMQDDGYLQLLCKLYLMENEYGQDAKSCYPGYFNSILYSQQGILPEINIVIQTKNMLTQKLNIKLASHAENTLKEYSITNLENFISKAQESFKLKGIGNIIVRDLKVEFYTLFSETNHFENEMTDDEVIKSCQHRFECKPDQLLTKYEPNYEKILAIRYLEAEINILAKEVLSDSHFENVDQFKVHFLNVYADLSNGYAKNIFNKLLREYPNLFGFIKINKEVDEKTAEAKCLLVFNCYRNELHNRTKVRFEEIFDGSSAPSAPSAPSASADSASSSFASVLSSFNSVPSSAFAFAFVAVVVFALASADNSSSRLRMKL